MINKTISKFIVFILDTNLNLIEGNLVNRNEFDITGTSEILRDDKTLKLSNKFGNFWKEYFVNKSFDKSTEFYLFVGKQASFTDTRIVYTWIKSQNMFFESDYFVSKLQESIDIESQNDLANLINNSKSSANKELLYSLEPRIGTK